MLPVVSSIRSTAIQMIAYTVVVMGLSLWFHSVAGTSFLYLSVAVAGGLAFLWRTIELLRRPNSVQAMKVFTYSIVYLGALFIAVAVDVLVYGVSA